MNDAQLKMMLEARAGSIDMNMKEIEESINKYGESIDNVAESLEEFHTKMTVAIDFLVSIDESLKWIVKRAKGENHGDKSGSSER